MQAASPAMASMSAGQAVLHGIGRFFLMFFASAAIGVVFALTAALISFEFLKELKFLELIFLFNMLF